MKYKPTYIIPKTKELIEKLFTAWINKKQINKTSNMKTIITTILLASTIVTSLNAQIVHTDTIVLIPYISVQTIYLDIDNDSDSIDDIAIANNDYLLNSIGVLAGGEILSINNNEIVKECQGYLDEFLEWQNIYAYVRQYPSLQIAEGNYSIPFRLLRLDTIDSQYKHKYGYLNMSIESNQDMIIRGWDINHTWNEGLDCDIAYTSIKGNEFQESKGSFTYYDLNGKVLNIDNLPLNQIIIKAYNNGLRDKVINTYK